MEGRKRGKRVYVKKKHTGSNKKEEKFQEKKDGLVRLNKYVANSGICSRREADKFIKAGLVKVNGRIVTELGTKVSLNDEVKYNDEKIRNEKKVYILLNKPKDYITSMKDENNRKTVMDLLRKTCKERVYPVGRLDRNTTGLILLTNDGDLAKKITHPKYEKKKVYMVGLNKNIKSNDLEKIANGIMLEDGFIKPDAIEYANKDDKREIGVEIHSGKNRIVRRIFEHLGYQVNKLDRVYYAGLTKRKLPRGKWRFLTEKEVNMLKMNAFE